MDKLSLLCCSLLLWACTSRTPASPEDQNTTGTTTGTTANWTEERRMQFLSDCVDNAKNQYSEKDAYALCKCMLGQVQKNYPDADSAALLQHLSDTAEVLQMIRNCK